MTKSAGAGGGFRSERQLLGVLSGRLRARRRDRRLSLDRLAALSDVSKGMLVQIERAKFYDPIGPGDTLVLETKIESTREASAQVTFEGRVAEKVAARGQLTFVMRAVDEPRIHQQRRDVYALWTRDFSPPLVLP